MGPPIDSRDRKADCQVQAYGDQRALHIGAVLLADHHDCTEETEDGPGCADGISIKWQEVGRGE